MLSFKREPLGGGEVGEDAFEALAARRQRPRRLTASKWPRMPGVFDRRAVEEAEPLRVGELLDEQMPGSQCFSIERLQEIALHTLEILGRALKILGTSWKTWKTLDLHAFRTTFSLRRSFEKAAHQRRELGALVLTMP